MNLSLPYTAIQRFYVAKSEVERTILLSCLFSIAILVARVWYTGHIGFVFLSWNLFLAYIPYGLSKKLTTKVSWIQSRLIFPIAVGVWLLFIPNAFYIITDLFHLQQSGSVPLWFGLVLLLSFAWNGLLLGILSVRQMEQIVIAKWGFEKEGIFLYPVMLLNALGVYIGRYLRFNSWDVVANPFGLAADVFQLLMHPVRNRLDWSMILCYAVFMTLMYTAIKRISKAVW